MFICRPDNWMIIEGPDKMPLPSVPELEADLHTSHEVPKPMGLH